MTATSIGMAVLAAVVTALLWVGAVVARKGLTGKKPEWNPLVLTQGPFGRASLSNLQLLYFLVLVVWIALYALFTTGNLVALSGDVLALVGIGAAGTAGVKVTATFRRRISSGNWGWLKAKDWIKTSIAKKRAEGPSAGDLVSTDGQFDVTKFQAVTFSIVIGASLVVTALTSPDSIANFQIDDSYLTLLGLSQVVYVGGKAVTPPTQSQLDDEITNLRNLESSFITKVASAWQANPPAARTMAEAMKVAQAEHSAYGAAAVVVAELVSDITGDPRVRSMEPALP